MKSTSIHVLDDKRLNSLFSRFALPENQSGAPSRHPAGEGTWTPMKYDFERLKLLCGRATCLPPLPASVFRLMEVTESSEFSANQIAAITSADPMLCAKLMRAANAGWDFAGMSRITSVQGAVMRLGLQAV